MKQPNGSLSDQDVVPYTEIAGRFSAELGYESLPTEVIEHVKLCLIDAVGCGLFGSQQRAGRTCAELAMNSNSSGASVLWGNSKSAPPSDAALVNGTAVHGFEIDDVHVASLLHPAAVVIPAVLALADERAATGQQIVTAIVAGYEVGIRIGITSGVKHATRGYHPTGTVGSPAAAAASANLLSLNQDEASHALALGATQAAGLYSARKGAMAKRLHAGRASQSGVLSALLAERGFTGAVDALEAPSGGFFSTMSPESNITAVANELGNPWETLQVGFKAYASCASTHTTIDAVGRLMARGLTAPKMKKLQISMTEVGVNNVGWRYVPDSVLSAQMNGYYAAAVKILTGDAFIDQYHQDLLADPQLMGLIDRIEIVHDPALDERGASARHVVCVTAYLVDGSYMEETVEQRLGSSRHPLDEHQIAQKFRRTAGAVLQPGRVEQLLDIIRHIDDVDDARQLSRLLTTT